MNGTYNVKTLSEDARQADGAVVSAGVKYGKAALVCFQGRKYAVNPHAILTINCTFLCNCNCTFCYNKKTFVADGEYVSPDTYEMGRIIEFARMGGIKVVALTGGEPTLDANKLLALVRKFKAAGFETVRLHTNGMALCRRICLDHVEKPLWWWLGASGLNDLSLSIADYRKEKNRKIMGCDNLSALVDFLPHVRECNMRVRLSCVLSKEGIYSIEDIKNYIGFATGNSVNYVIFRIEPSLNPLESPIIDSVAVQLCAIGFSVEYSHVKSDSTIYELRSGSVQVCLSCVKEELDPDKKVRRLIYMPNRVVYTSWIDSSSILFEEDAGKIVKYATSSQNHESCTRESAIIPSYIFQGSGFRMDLHVHSSVSDGENSPVSVLSAAAKAGITTLVFTEHNAIHDSIGQLKGVAKTMGIDMPLVGVEFSTVYCMDGNPLLKFHLLVYGKSVDQFSFMKDLFNPNDPKNDYLISLYWKLYAQNMISKRLQDIYLVEDSVAPTRKKMLTRKLLVNEVVANCGLSEREVSEVYVPKMDERERYRKYLNVSDVISLARDSGCATVVAHPGWVRPYNESVKLSEEDVLCAIVRLSQQGLQGVETVHRLNDVPTRVKLCRLAERLGLVITGGSDYHGRSRCFFGQNGITERGFDQLWRIIR